MRAVGLKVLKNKLSEYVRLAASGETVLVTDRDRVVAELVPPSADRAQRPASSAALEDLIRRGEVRRPITQESSPPLRVSAEERIPFDEIMQGLDQDRSDRT